MADLIAKHLAQSRFPSKEVVVLDTILTDAIFGQHAMKAQHRQHHPLSFHPAGQQLVDTATREIIKNSFNVTLSKMKFSKVLYEDHSRLLALELIRGIKEIKAVGLNAKSVLQW